MQTQDKKRTPAIMPGGGPPIGGIPPKFGGGAMQNGGMPVPSAENAMKFAGADECDIVDETYRQAAA